MCVLWRALSSFFEYPGYTLFTGYIGAIAPHEGTVRASVGRICLLLVPFSDGELSAHKIPESLIVHRYIGRHGCISVLPRRIWSAGVSRRLRVSPEVLQVK
jgi:hypothetical protein